MFEIHGARSQGPSSSPLPWTFTRRRNDDPTPLRPSNDSPYRRGPSPQSPRSLVREPEGNRTPVVGTMWHGGNRDEHSKTHPTSQLLVTTRRPKLTTERRRQGSYTPENHSEVFTPLRPRQTRVPSYIRRPPTRKFNHGTTSTDNESPTHPGSYSRVRLRSREYV